MKEISAVEWLVYVVQSNIAPNYIPKEIVEQAKQMEKEQIIKASYYGADSENSSYEQAEQYYYETFEQQKDV
jgi:hypothetical protein